MRIVLLTPDVRGTSGWSRYALDLGRALAQRGHEIHCVVATAIGADWCTEHAILRDPMGYLGSSLLRRYHAWILQRRLRRIQPDVVHVIAEPYTLLFPLMPRGSWKEILTIHGTYSIVPLLINSRTRALAEAYYRRMDHVVAVSAFTKNTLLSRFPDLAADIAKKIDVIHNAISLDGITADTAKRPADRVYHLLTVSAVKRKKGHLQALRAIRAFLGKQDARLRYDIVGNDRIDPGFTQELLREAEVLGLQDVVRLRGKLTDAELDEAYREADLFLLPSLQEGDYFEGFGLVFLEANARGTPVIGGDTGGCPEAIAEGVSGYVCNPEHADTLAEAMVHVLLNNTIDRNACRQWAEEHDIRYSAETIVSIYSSTQA